MNKLILVRGAPGSGKSTFAEKLASEIVDDVVIYTTDDYFMSKGFVAAPINLRKTMQT